MAKNHRLSMFGWKQVCCLLQIQGVTQVPLVLTRAQWLGAPIGVQHRDNTSYIGAATTDGTECRRYYEIMAVHLWTPLKRTGDNLTKDFTNFGTGNEHINFHINFHFRHVWTMMRGTFSKQSWKLTIPDIHRARAEGQHKRFKFLGNVGPANMIAEPVEVFPIFNKCNSFSEAGFRLMRKGDALLQQRQMRLERKAACEKWTSLVLSNPGCWTVARPKKGESLMDLWRNETGEFSKDYLGTKATDAFYCRANALPRFAQYSEEKFIEPSLIMERMEYQFLKFECHATAFSKTYLTLVSCAKYTLEPMDADEVRTSCRAKGSSTLQFAMRRQLAQRQPSKLTQIAILGEMVSDIHGTAYDNVAAGSSLLMDSGILHSDAQTVTGVEFGLPVGEKHAHFEAATERYKTNATLEKKMRRLPILAPKKSFTEDGWVSQWPEVRTQSKMQVGSSVPLLPSPVAGGGWLKTPQGCEAAGDWPRALFRALLALGSGSRAATHSCKALPLVMCAKYGMELATRHLLGRHVSGREKTCEYTAEAQCHDQSVCLKGCWATSKQCLHSWLHSERMIPERRHIDLLLQRRREGPLAHRGQVGARDDLSCRVCFRHQTS